MGKPAARVGDLTSHGGTIVVPGAPTVLIGKMPAATLTSMHVCPMLTGPVPHVGGPVILGSTGVFLGKMPAARMGDMAVCVGPPDSIVLGCMTVLIGEVGSGSQASSAGSPTAAAAAQNVGPAAITAYPLAEPGPTTENHAIECEFVDSAGKPLAGVPYRIEDPNQGKLIGVSTSDGKAYHGGYAKAGGFKVDIFGLSNAKWKNAKVKMGTPAEFSVEANLSDTETKVQVNLFARHGHQDQFLFSKMLPIKNKKVEGSWEPTLEDLPAIPEVVLSAGEKAPPPQSPTYFFVCHAPGLVSVSDFMRLVDDLEFELQDEKGQGVGHADYEAAFPSGEIKKGKLDGQGKAKITDVEPGMVKIHFPKIQNEDKAKAEEDEQEKEEAKEENKSEEETEKEESEEEKQENEDKNDVTKNPEKSDKFLFPLKKRPVEDYKAKQRFFKAKRPGDRLHAGCDLIAPEGTEIRAVADGKIQLFYLFYQGTYALEVDHDTFVARYSEVKPQLAPGLKIGSLVTRGQVIAHVGLMTSGSHMLHFELYSKKVTGPLTQRGNPPFQRRSDLIDPTPFLDQAEME